MDMTQYRLNIVLLHVVHLREHMLPNPVSGQGSEFNICDMYMPTPQHMCRAIIRRWNEIEWKESFYIASAKFVNECSTYI